jgi:hypothetical protein
MLGSFYWNTDLLSILCVAHQRISFSQCSHGSYEILFYSILDYMEMVCARQYLWVQKRASGEPFPIFGIICRIYYYQDRSSVLLLVDEIL